MNSNAKLQMLDFVFTFIMVRFDVIGTVTFNISKIVTIRRIKGKIQRQI